MTNFRPENLLPRASRFPPLPIVSPTPAPDARAARRFDQELGGSFRTAVRLGERAYEANARMKTPFEFTLFNLLKWLALCQN